MARNWMTLNQYLSSLDEYHKKRLIEDLIKAKEIYAFPQSFDRYGVVNVVAFYVIENNRLYRLTPNLYCGGVYGMDRMYDTLYQLASMLGIKNPMEIARKYVHL